MQLTAAIVGPAHGLRGEVIVDVRSDDPEVLAPGARLDIAGEKRHLTVRSVRVHKERVLASFEECNSREEAEALGTVSGLTPGAAQDLLLVATERGTVMVPFVTALVPTVDVEGGVVIIDAPPGLFDDDAVSEREGR